MPGGGHELDPVPRPRPRQREEGTQTCAGTVAVTGDPDRAGPGAGSAGATG